MVLRRRTLLIALVVLAGLVFVTARPDRETRFIKAVREGNAKAVAALLEAKPELAQLQRPHKAGSTPVLYLALSAGHDEIVRLLVNSGARPDKYRHALLLVRNIETARLLIEHGADVNRQGMYGDAPLHFFAAIDDTAMLEFLLSQGAEVDVRSQHDETPLHEAAREGSLNAARLLVSNGADVGARSKQNKTPLDYAVMTVWDEDAYGMGRDRIRSGREVGAFLVSCGSARSVFDLAWLGDIDRLTEQLATDTDLVNAQANGESLLFAAVRGGSADMVQCLLENGGRLKVVGRHQQTPLQVAAYVGHVAVAEVLLSHGVEVDEAGPWGETALHWTAFRGHAEVAALLLNRGADPNIQTSRHTVDLNVRADDVDPIERELKWFRLRERHRGSNVQFASPARLAFTTGDTPLHVAAYWNHPDIVALLVSHGVDIDGTNRWGDTALHIGVVCGHTDVVEKLFDAGADPLTRTQNGVTAVALARQIKNQELVKLMSK